MEKILHLRIFFFSLPKSNIIQKTRFGVYFKKKKSSDGIEPNSVTYVVHVKIFHYFIKICFAYFNEFIDISVVSAKSNKDLREIPFEKVFQLQRMEKSEFDLGLA